MTPRHGSKSSLHGSKSSLHGVRSSWHGSGSECARGRVGTGRGFEAVCGWFWGRFPHSGPERPPIGGFQAAKRRKCGKAAASFPRRRGEALSGFRKFRRGFVRAREAPRSRLEPGRRLFCSDIRRFCVLRRRGGQETVPAGSLPLLSPGRFFLASSCLAGLSSFFT